MTALDHRAVHDLEETLVTMTDGRPPTRAVVVSVGAVTSMGATAHELWDGIVAGRVAIPLVRLMSMDGFRTSIAGEVGVDVVPEHDVGYPKGPPDRALDFALLAAEEAMSVSAQLTELIPREQFGVIIGTCNAGLLSAEHWYQKRELGESTDRRLLQFVSPQSIAEALAGAFDLRGPALSINTACAAGANTVGYAAELIRYGQADAVLAGGTDALSDVLIAGFNCLESLSPRPAAPYSKDREGLSLGEGSGMLVLMRDDLAHQLGLRALAEVGGLGLSADGYHATAPHPGGLGASRAIQAALRAAGVTAEQVRYVNSHGTGTAKNDPAETMALKVGLGPAAYATAVSSTKSMIGHLLGAAGAVEAIVSVKVLEQQLAPPTANFTEADPDCDLDYVPNTARAIQADVVMSNNFAFGGANASLVLTREGWAPLPSSAVQDVVITGIGALTPAGTQPGDLWEAYSVGRDCTQDAAGIRVGRVDCTGRGLLSPKVLRRMDRLGILSVVASSMALSAADLTIDESTKNRVGVILGTGLGPMESMEAFARPLLQEGPRAASPAVFPNTVYNAATGQVAMQLGVVGPTTTITTGHAAGGSALIYAAELLAHDQADAMLALAADTLTDTVIDGYRSIRSDGGGFPISEAGVAVLLERRSYAEQRGAAVLGRILGHATAGDGLGVGRWDSEGRGMERAIRLALDRSGVQPNDVAAVWSSMTGYRRADDAEQAALTRVFGSDPKPVLHAPKKLLGEPIGAGAQLSTCLAVESWARGRELGPALVLSSSMGGTHVALVITSLERATP